MATKWEKSSPELIEKFYEVMKHFGHVELRKMFGYPCAFLNGNMCVGLHQQNLAVRLSEKDRETALKKGDGEIFAPMNGRVMKEYVALSPAIIDSPASLKEFVTLAVSYVEELPPKLAKLKPAKK